MHTVHLYFSLTKKDYLEFGKYNNVASKEGRKNMIRQAAGNAVAAAIAFISLLLFQPEIATAKVITYMCIFTILYALFLYLGLPGTYKKLYEKMAGHPDNQSLYLETSFIFFENGITTNDAEEEHVMKWAAIKRKVETNDYFYLYKNALQAIIIPKQKFENAEKLNSFRILLSKHLSLEADKAPPDLK